MARRAALILAGLLALHAPSASAQKVEASFSVGYGGSEGITSNNKPLLGRQYDRLAVDSGASVDLALGFFLNERMEGEFLWSRQNSRLEADGPAGQLRLSELALYNYMFNLVYNWGMSDARVRPYAFGGIGATNYSFGDLLLPTPLRSTASGIEGETRFSTNWGAGVKFYIAPSVGAKIGLRWTPTYIKSDPGGVWCDPFYGCWQLADADYSNQFETSFGITIRF